MVHDYFHMSFYNIWPQDVPEVNSDVDQSVSNHSKVFPVPEGLTNIACLGYSVAKTALQTWRMFLMVLIVNH